MIKAAQRGYITCPIAQVVVEEVKFNSKSPDFKFDTLLHCTAFHVLLQDIQHTTRIDALSVNTLKFPSLKKATHNQHCHVIWGFSPQRSLAIRPNKGIFDWNNGECMDWSLKANNKNKYSLHLKVPLCTKLRI